MEDITSKIFTDVLTHEHMLKTMPFDMVWSADPEDPEKVDPVTVILATAVWSTRYLGLIPPNYDKTIIQ